MATQQLKTWNARVHQDSGSKELGQVHETSEEQVDEGTKRAGIYPSDDFDVSPA
ncbi:hypothetical protein OKW43_007817 [Paraburkholderia sp. WC7.3g]|uniref:hypothetical protein n=1 Tax=Paraburkholderia sp. WC7.3g TaxID=2991070 RepID=UPI003D233003